MNYMLLIAESAEGFAERNSENAPAYWNGWMAYSAAIVEAGIFVSGAGLAGPETATVLRFDTKGQRVQDGPFIDSKEQVGGFFIIDVPDLDAALDWARKAPITRGGSVEVRPAYPRRRVTDAGRFRLIERVFQASSGRLTAYLAARFGDVALAEDALSAAFAAALRVWPEAGVPTSPDAWLYQVARRAILDTLRRRKTAAAYAGDPLAQRPEAEEAPGFVFRMSA